MKNKIQSQMTRRQWLHFGAGTMLALGLWPGSVRWAEAGQGDSFRFVVLNDTHFQSPKCPAWFERVRASVLAQQPKPALCLVVGDLSEHGNRAELGPMRELLRAWGIDFHVVMGNHDHLSNTEHSPWNELFGSSANYAFEHRGWQFIGLDSTQGREWQGTKIQPATLQWVDEHLPKLKASAPTVLFTHFPLGPAVISRPLNADDLLERFKNFNLVAAFDGHFHGFTERKFGSAILTTNRCCAISRTNHDGSPEKGYFLCTAKEGRIQREFVEVKPA